MKPTQTLLAAVILGTSLFTATQANATLISALGGQVVNDTDRNITWLANANLATTNTFGVSGISPAGSMNWYTAQKWIAAMNTTNYLGYNDWRLPTTLQPDASCDFQQSGGSISSGYNCTGSEMGHLFSELGGVAGHVLFLTHNVNYDLFQDLQANFSWSGTEYAPSVGYVWGFSTYGDQISIFKGENYFALAVRPGQVAAAPPTRGTVPEPGTLLLMGAGLMGIAARRRLALR